MTTKNVKRKHGQIWKRNVNNDKQQQKLKDDGMQQQHEMKTHNSISLIRLYMYY